jgi:hypothetical protein
MSYICRCEAHDSCDVQVNLSVVHVGTSRDMAMSRLHSMKLACTIGFGKDSLSQDGILLLAILSPLLTTGRPRWVVRGRHEVEGLLMCSLVNDMLLSSLALISRLTK